MMNAAFFGQMIILIVFLPILTLEGVEGKMFKPMALTFIFTMIGAMILCLTYVPAVSALFLKTKTTEKRSWGDRAVHWLENRYEKLLGSVLKSAKIVVGASVAMFVVCLFIFTKMGGEFIPQLDEGDIAFHIILKPGSSLEEGITTSTKIEKLLLDTYPEITQVVSRFGVSDIPTDPMPMDMGDSFIILKEKSAWTSAETKVELIEKIKETLSVIPGVSYEFSQPIEMRFNELISGVREDIAVKLYGEDLDVLAAKAEEMGQIISTIEGVSDLKVEATTGLPQITVDYKRNKVAQYGLNIKDLNMLVRSAFAGGQAGVVFEGERRIELVVRLADKYRSNIDHLKNLYVPLATGTQIPLREVADISYKLGPMQISRDNTNRRTYVGINIRNRDVKSVVDDIKEKLNAQFELPSGYYIRYGGAFENFERAIAKLEIVVPIALLLIFVMIYFALNSFKQTSMIYVAIPLAAIGGVLSLWIRGMPFSISAGVGFIVLFGVAVLNGLVLISGLNELKNEGVTDINKRIRLGTRRRIRPILLTALTDVLGFLPMAVSVSSGAEVQRPLATVVIGGMITSTFLTLFVLPILYKWMEERSVRLKVKPKTALLIMGLCLSFSVTAQQQGNLDFDRMGKESKPIDQQQAVELALANFPLLKNKKLEIEQQKALKKTAWDLGTTKIFTGGEEINDGNGVYTTIGLQQQDIDVFGIVPKLRLRNEQIFLAEKGYELSRLELEQKVKTAWSKAYVAKSQLLAYKQLDSVYNEFERAVALRYEVEAISRLQWLSAKNQASQIHLKRQQSQRNYNIALEKLNLWMGGDRFYEVSASLDTSFSPLELFRGDSVDHPAIELYKQEVEVAQAKYNSIRSEFLPKLNLEGGKQEVNDNGGFYSFQAGISIPILSGKSYGQTKAARIEAEIATQSAAYHTAALQSNYRTALQDYLKWEESWSFYENQALPLAEEQQRAALMAFNEGAIAYVQFIQMLDKVVELELDALQALENYLEARATLEYFANDKTN
jgi:cobalt-zinc-cadmium resistance protein CzcA